MSNVSGPPRPGDAQGAAALQPKEGDQALYVPHKYDISQAGQCPYKNAINAKDAGAMVKVAEDILNNRVMFGDQALDKARLALEQAVSFDDSDPKTLLMLGQVDFQMERWGDAVNALEAAQGCTADPATAKAVQALLSSARERVESRVDTLGGPTLDDFGAKDTAGNPVIIPLPVTQGAPQSAYVSPRARIESLWGKVEGKMGTLTGDIATQVAQMADRYQPLVNEAAAELAAKTQADPTEARKFTADLVGRAAIVLNKFALTDGVWTNWDKDLKIQGLLKMAVEREWLLKNAIHSTYPDGTKTPYSGRQVSDAESDSRRLPDGSNNIPGDPGRGMGGTRFLSLGPTAAQRINRAEDKSLPNVEDLSQVFLKPNGQRKTAAFLNGLGGEWIQPQIHDWEGLFSSRPSEGTDKIPLSPLAQDLKDKYGIKELEIPKTPKDPTQKDGQLTQLNEHTAWWDGSEIYGDNAQTAARLRAGPDGKPLPCGKLRLDVDSNGKVRLPLNPKTGVEDTGVSENWWLGLDALHTLFVQNHNSICDMLEKAHGKGTPDNWDSDQIFEKARLINAALMAKIHTTEWTPDILPNSTSVAAMNTNWFGLKETLTKAYKDRRVVREGKPDDPVMGGIVGNKWTDDQMMYNFSREFAIVYRTLHNSLPDNIEVTKLGETVPSQVIPMEKVRGQAARKVAEDLGMTNVFNSMGTQHANAMVLHNAPKWSTDTSAAGAPILDLGATDIYRARETGVLPYNEFRRQLGLKPIRTFDDLTNDKDTLAKLRNMYCKDWSTNPPKDIPESQAVERLDLEVGALAELYRPKDFVFGETIFQVFIIHASRRLAADPWYTSRFDAGHYTKEGLALIDGVPGADGKAPPSTMKTILLAQHPDLKKSGLMNVDNGFEPWGSTAWSNPEEHPLFWSENYGMTDSVFIPVVDKATGKKYVVDLDAENVLSAQTGEGTVDVNHVYKGPDAQAILDAARGKASPNLQVGPKFGAEAATVMRHGAPCQLDGTVPKNVKDWEPAWMKGQFKAAAGNFVQKVEDRVKAALDSGPIKDPSPVSTSPDADVKSWAGPAQWKPSVPPRTQDAELAQRVKDLMPKLQAAFKPQDGDTARAQHRKGTYATAQATFTRDPSLPKGLQAGAFSQDKLRAIVRLSNVDGRAQSDEKPDLRGIAIRFTDDKGHIQDLMMNSSVNFMAKDANEAIIGAAVRGEGPEPLLAATLKSVTGTKNALSASDAERLVKDGVAVQTKGISLAATSFWSRTYFQLGDSLVKLRLVPADDKVDPTPRVTGDNSLTQDLASRLTEGPVRYKLQVQGYIDDQKTPLNDERAVWNSPWVTVGELDLPQSNVPADATAAQIEKNVQGAKALTFSIANRWDNSGGSMDPQYDEINRLRLAAYPSSQDGRGADRVKGGRCPMGFD